MVGSDEGWRGCVHACASGLFTYLHCQAGAVLGLEIELQLFVVVQHWLGSLELLVHALQKRNLQRGRVHERGKGEG